MTKLYNVPRNTWVRPIQDAIGPPGAKTVYSGEAVKLHHIDGMYSFCHDIKGDIVHLRAWEEVEIIDKSEPLK